MMTLNLDSPEQLSLLLFGGVKKEIVKEPVIDAQGNIVVFQSGKKKGEVRFKNTEKNIVFKGLGLNPLPEWETKKKGIYQTNETVLSILSSYLKKNTDLPWHTPEQEASLIALKILNIRGLQKQLSTYYESLEKLVYEDGYIHPQFKHVQTDTGRLSCGDPNVQNQPSKENSKAKQHFVSRFK